MSATRCYLDFNATAPLRASARDACIAALEVAGNPSSIHREGRDARHLVEESRSAVAHLLRGAAEGVVFTASGTEAANLLVAPGMRRGSDAPVERLLVSATEHAAVLRGHRFAADRVTVLPVGQDGVLDLDALRRALVADGGRPALLALQAANNETGVLQPLRAAADLVHAADGLMVCDGVQAPGRMPLTLAHSGVDAVILSGHKIGAPKGIGAAVLAESVTLAGPLIRGGGQERGMRSGTENVVGIAGFGTAARAVERETSEPERMASLQAVLEVGLRSLCDEAVIFGAGAARLPNTTCFALPGLSAETLLMAFDLEGVAISSGSACSSGKVTRSHVLDAMGIAKHEASGALRISLGWSSSAADVDRFLQVLADIMRRMQRRPVSAAA